MTMKTKAIMMFQGSCLLLYWPSVFYLVKKANHPPMSILVVATAMSVVFGVIAITANLYRDRLSQNRAGLSVLNSFTVLCSIISISVINIAGGACQVLRMAPEQRGNEIYVIGGMLAIWALFALALIWCVFWWWLSRRCNA